jgi:lauroyl/myristoyl acyltransferase
MQGFWLDVYHLGHFVVAESVGRLPSARLRARCIDGLAHIAHAVSRRKRGQIERSIDRAFAGRLGRAEIHRITVACFREFWQEMVDWVPTVNARLPAAEVEIRGLEHLQQALTRGKGAILWESNGFSRRVQAKRALHAHGIRLVQTHGETHLGVMRTDRGEGSWLRRRLMRSTYEQRESAYVAETLIIPVQSPMASGRAYLKRLRANAVVCMAGDGRIARKLYPIDFLGQRVIFAPGAVKLAQLAGAPLLPMFWIPDPDGPRLEIDPPIVPDPSGDVDAVVVDCLQQFARGLEARVLRWPEAYRNWHMVEGGAVD